jgi:hypothetical protein
MASQQHGLDELDELEVDGPRIPAMGELHVHPPQPVPRRRIEVAQIGNIRPDREPGS